MNHGSLFSGIGGFDLAAQWVGWDNMFHSEIDPFCLTVLKHHFPNATTYTDIKETDFTSWRGKIDILSGGFPCQGFSQAGKRKGTDDPRYLWPEMYRAIQEIRPRWVLAENVLGITNWNGGMVFEQVCSDLEAEGYSVQPFVLPACGVNAPHQRYRTWFIAHRNDDQLKSGLSVKEWDWQSTIAYGGFDGNGNVAYTNDTGGRASECGDILYGKTDSKEWEHTLFGVSGYGEDFIGEYDDVRYTYRDGSHQERETSERENTKSGGVCGNGGSRTVADTKSERFQRGWSESSRTDGDTPKRSDILDRASRSGIQRTAADPDSAGLQETRSEQPTTRASGTGIQWTSSHTYFGGLEGATSLGRDSQYVERENGINGEDASHPQGTGQQTRFEGQGEIQSWGTDERNGLSKDWQDFPTQSPVCGRNDGLSFVLDGITFPKWRTESIKAYGNAIVPQIAYRIFRVMEYMSNGK